MVFNSREYQQFEARLRLGLNELKTGLGSVDWDEPAKAWRGDFFQEFTIPNNDLNTVRARVYLNLDMFKKNYAYIIGALLLVYFPKRLSSVLVVGGIAATFLYVVRSPTPIVIQGKRIGVMDKYRIFVIASLFLLYATGILSLLFQFLSLSAFVVLTHAALRNSKGRQRVKRRVINPVSRRW